MAVAFIFPGQGSQSVGMMSALAEQHAVVQKTFEEASSVLGYDLWNLVANGPEDELNQTDKTQPAMMAAGVATWRIWQEQNGELPSYLAGHSLGEYTALVCAGAMSLSDGISLVADRGRFMQQAVPAGSGAMAAILGLEDEAVVNLCADNAAGQVLEAVNFNSPGQVVIAGETAAVDRLIASAEEVGAKKAIKLPVSVPSHCALMKPAAEQLAIRIEQITFSEPMIPVIHNADVTSYTDESKIKDALVRQLYSPVRWVETINLMKENGIDKIIECGPGKVLAGLNKRIDRRMPALPIIDQASLEKALA